MLAHQLAVSRKAVLVHSDLREALQQWTVQRRERFRSLGGQSPAHRVARELVEARRARPAPFGAPCAQECVFTQRIALKSAARLEDCTNGRPPQEDGIASFKRLFDAGLRNVTLNETIYDVLVNLVRQLKEFKNGEEWRQQLLNLLNQLGLNLINRCQYFDIDEVLVGF